MKGLNKYWFLETFLKITYPLLCRFLSVELIDELAKNVYNETNVACSYDEQGLKRRGYLIMVAAMPKMVRTYTVK